MPDRNRRDKPTSGWFAIVVSLLNSSFLHPRMQVIHLPQRGVQAPTGAFVRLQFVGLKTNEERRMKVSNQSWSVRSHAPENWHAIDWRFVERNVRATQLRITKAVQENKLRKAKALQRMLTRSFCAKALAVRRVTENQGKRTPGIDKELWKTPTEKHEAIGRLDKRGYRPMPLRRVFIPKANGKQRPLGIPVMLDRAMQALHLLALEPVSESRSDPNSYGFRINRSTHDAMSQLFVSLSQTASAQWVLEARRPPNFE